MLARSALAALALLPLVAACGEPQRVVANPTYATRPPEPTIEPTVFPGRSPSAAATSGAPSPGTTTTGSPGAGAVTDKVDATDQNRFVPEAITVKAGTKVTWNNVGGFHTVTGGTPDKQDTSLMNGTLASPGATYQVTFAKPGKYPYFCQPHATLNMVGEVVVT